MSEQIAPPAEMDNDQPEKSSDKDKFQSRVLEKKRENYLREVIKRQSKKNIGDNLLIFRRAIIWEKIIINVFRKLRFDNFNSFSDFTPLIHKALTGISDGSLGEFAIAVGTQDITDFIIDFETLRRADCNDTVRDMLGRLSVFFVVNTAAEASEILKKFYGESSIIIIDEEVEDNIEKVRRVLEMYK